MCNDPITPRSGFSLCSLAQFVCSCCCSIRSLTGCLPMKAEQHIRRVEAHNRADNVVGTKEVALYVGPNPKASMPEVAEALVRQGFGELKDLVPRRPVRAALGLRPRDKYWLHMFDALALGTGARSHS